MPNSELLLKYYNEIKLHNTDFMWINTIGIKLPSDYPDAISGESLDDLYLNHRVYLRKRKTQHLANYPIIRKTRENAL